MFYYMFYYIFSWIYNYAKSLRDLSAYQIKLSNPGQHISCGTCPVSMPLAPLPPPPPTPPTSHPTPPLPCNWVRLQESAKRWNNVDLQSPRATDLASDQFPDNLILLTSFSHTHALPHCTPHPHPQTPHILRLYNANKNVYYIAAQHEWHENTVLIWS